MNKILQFVELLLQAMEREPKRFKVEIIQNRLYVHDFKKMKAKIFQAVMPTVYTYNPEPATEYQSWCNDMFRSFLDEIDRESKEAKK